MLPLQEQLRQRIDAWEAAGAPPSVLRIIRDGAALPFQRAPPRFRQRSLQLRSPAERSAWTSLRDQYLANGAIRRATTDDDVRCISASFLIPKKEPGAYRFIIDLRRLNKYLRKLHCRYGSLKQLHGRRLSHFVSFDLTDAYHAVGVLPQHQPYLGFEVEGELFVCSALPFGLSASPAIFCSVARVLRAALLRDFDPGQLPPPPPPLPPPPLSRPCHKAVTPQCKLAPVRRRRDLEVVHYLDDFLLACATHALALEVARRAVALTSFLGFKLNLKKSTLHPVTVIESLGLEVDGDNHVFRVSPSRAARISQAAKRLLLAAAGAARWVRVADLAQFCGLANSCSLAAPTFALHLRPLYSAIYSAGSRHVWQRGTVVRLPHSALQGLKWFISVPSWYSQSPFWAPQRGAAVLWTDASDLGWGAVFAAASNSPAAPVVASGAWTAAIQEEAIHVRELRAVLRGLSEFQPLLRPGQEVQLWTDNMAVLYMIRKWSSRDPACLPLLHALAGRLEGLQLRLQVRYIRSEDNPADGPSRLLSG
jgi:hypothetical protein